MRFLGLTFGEGKQTEDKAVPLTGGQLVPTVPSSQGGIGGWFGSILEPFTGAWQRNIELDRDGDLLAFSAIYACVNLRSSDIAKLRLKLVQQKEGGLWVEVTDPAVPFLAVLRKPNHFQTRIQFIKQWVVNLLLNGNCYILKERDLRGIVTALYCLNPRAVVPLVAPDGSILYQIGRDPLMSIDADKGITVPASEIIHDRMMTPYHPLIGVSPIYACAMSGSQGRRIQQQSAKFFENQSRPSGILTAPGPISDVIANRLKAEWERNYSAGNIGRVAVLGDSLKYDAMTIPAAQAQLVEQLRWTVEDVARCFLTPLHMLSVPGSNPSYNNIGALNQAYYSQTLQENIESIEALLDEGLGLMKSTQRYGVEFDLDSLVRMDPSARAETHAKEIQAGYKMPNEARYAENRAPVKGGDACYLQVQNYSLEALARRDEAAAAPGSDTPAQEPTREPEAVATPNEDPGAAEDATLDAVALGLSQALIRKFSEALLHA